MEICENSFSRRTLFHLSQLQRIEDELFCLQLRLGYLLDWSTKSTVLITQMERTKSLFVSAVLVSSPQSCCKTSDLKFSDVFCSLLEKVRFSPSREYRSWCGDICTRIILCSVELDLCRKIKIAKQSFQYCCCCCASYCYLQSENQKGARTLSSMILQNSAFCFNF